MTDELLRRMTSALRDEYDGASATPEVTRARVIRALAERRPRRKKWLVVGFPAFVLLGGSTAWAAATGKLDRIVAQAIEVMPWQTGPSAPPAASVALRHSPTGRSSAASPVPDEAADEGAADAEIAPAHPTPLPAALAMPSAPRQPRAAQIPPGDTTREAAPTPASERPETSLPLEDHTALLTFRGAHRAQFSEGNCARAVTQYEAYLGLAPDGPFAMEARYNRGVCLVKLGRPVEARSALTPFAQGAYGDYRRSQSAQLLNALESDRQAP